MKDANKLEKKVKEYCQGFQDGFKYACILHNIIIADEMNKVFELFTDQQCDKSICPDCHGYYLDKEGYCENCGYHL